MSRRPSSSKRVHTLEPETAHERHQRLYALKQSYAHGRRPARPKSKTELDVLKEHHQFIRDASASSSSANAALSWEDQVALKYYNSLFREFAVVNLKHYRSGAVR